MACCFTCYCTEQLGYFRALHASSSVASSPSSRYSGAEDSLAEDEDDGGGAKARRKAGDSNSKRPWSREENEKLMQLVKQYGAKRWSLIAMHLPGRVGKQCRER